MTATASINRLGEPPLRASHFGQTEVSARVAGPIADRLLVEADRGIELASLEKKVRLFHGECETQWIDLPRLASQLKRLVRSTERPALESLRRQEIRLNIPDEGLNP